jgi:transitional endoplasmic reticulum ATPase
MIYVDMPDLKARESQFRLALSNLPVEENVDYSRLAELTKGYNCSDISYIIKLASRKKFNESIMDVESKSFKPITQALLEEVIASKSPSVSSRDLKEFERVRMEFSPKDEGCKRMAVGFR